MYYQVGLQKSLSAELILWITGHV